MHFATHASTTEPTDGRAGTLAERLARLRMLDVVLTPAATRLGGVFIATGPFVAGRPPAGHEAELSVALVFEEPRRPLAERAAAAAAAAAGLTLRFGPSPLSGGDVPTHHIVFGDRRSCADGRRAVRPGWTRSVEREPAGVGF
jgi:hypothetical protein